MGSLSIMTVNDSSSSATNPPDPQKDLASPRGSAFELDLLTRGNLPPLPSALFQGLDHDLLKPVRFLEAGALPSGPAPDVDRSELARALETANAAYGHPAAKALARKLADPATRGGGHRSAARALRWSTVRTQQNGRRRQVGRGHRGSRRTSRGSILGGDRGS